MRAMLFSLSWFLMTPALACGAGGCMAPKARRPGYGYRGSSRGGARLESVGGVSADRAPASPTSTYHRGHRRHRTSRFLSKKVKRVLAERGARRSGSGVASVAPAPRAGAARQVAGPRPTPARGQPGRLIVYRANLQVMVLGLKDAMEEAQKLALAVGGYLQNRANRVLVLRVPVERFHDLLRRLEKLGEVTSKSVNAEDVTRQYSDLRVRLRAAEAVLERLKALLVRAKNVKESLAIEREMARLLEKIERIKGTLRFLQHHASLSTIRIYFRQRPAYSRPVRSQWRNPFRWVRSLGLYSVMRF